MNLLEKNDKRSARLYTEYCKAFMKENKDDLNKWNDTHFHGAEVLALLRWQCYINRSQIQYNFY